VYNTK